MDPSARLYRREQSMRKWAFASYRLVRVVPTGGGRSVALRPPSSVQLGSTALGGAGLTARLAVLVALVAGLLAVGLLALSAAGLTALTTIHGATHAG